MRIKLSGLNQLAAALLCLVAVFVNFIICQQSLRDFGTVSDLPEFYCPARLVASHNGNQVYDLSSLRRAENELFPSLNGRTIVLFVPPPGIPWLVPFACVPAHIIPVFWKVIGTLALLISTVLLGNVFSLTLQNCLWLIAWLGLTAPLVEALRMDQLAPFLLLAFCLALWAIKRKRPVLAALALSFYCLKPHEIAPFLIVLLACNRISILAYGVAFSLLLALISVICLGFDGIANYAKVLSLTPSEYATIYMRDEIGPNYRGQLLRLFPHSSHTIALVSFALMLLTLFMIFMTMRRFSKSTHWLEVGTLVSMPLRLLSCVHCLPYDLILLTPSIVALLKYRSKLEVHSWLIFSLPIFAVFFFFPIYSKINGLYVKNGGVVNPFFICLLIFAISVFVLVNANAAKLKDFLDNT